LQLEEHGPKIVFVKGIHNTVADQSHGFSMTPVSIKQPRATLRRKSIRSQKQSETRTGGQSQIQWCKLKVVTSKHEDFNLMFTNHGKEDGIYPLKRDSNAQNKDQRSIVTTCKNTYKGFAFSTY
jgi:hypothetical protein